MNPILFQTLRATIGAVLTVGSVEAATINWGTGAQNITGVSDVTTTGTLVYALNVGPSGVSSTTVNTVSFAPFAFPTNNTTGTLSSGNISFVESPGTLWSGSTFGFGATPYSNLPGPYQNLLSYAGYATGTSATLTLTMSGLTVGQNYQFEWWTNNAGLANASDGSGNGLTVTTATAGNAVSLNANVANSLGGTGQFAVGTFTADGTSQSVVFSAATNNDPLINGFQLRTNPVPEPSTFMLVGMSIFLGTLKMRVRKPKS